MPSSPRCQPLTIDELTIEDEASFRHVGLYADLKQVLRAGGYRFQVLPPGPAATADRALMLSLAYWGAEEGSGLLVDASIPADVVAHAAWHHLAARAFAKAGAPMSADALFFGEALASAFDVYLIGRLLGHAPHSSFLATQVPAMSQAAEGAGVSAEAFAALLAGIAADPDRAFEDLRALLLDVTTALVACPSAQAGFDVLAGFDGHRFACLLHHYALAEWLLFARAYASHALGPDAEVRKIDQTLRAHQSPLDWLTNAWVIPGMTAS
jgi:hypothetical protein